MDSGPAEEGGGNFQDFLFSKIDFSRYPWERGTNCHLTFQFALITFQNVLKKCQAKHIAEESIELKVGFK